MSLSPSGVTPTEDLTVNYGTSNGTATAGTDYMAKSGTLTFTSAAAGAQTITVETTEDKVDEGTGETFTVTISSPSGGGGPAPSLGTSSVSTTITDDDTASGITLSVSPSSVREDDDATNITVTATLDDGITRVSDTVVTIGTLEGTAVSSDYSVTKALASITIPANSLNAIGTLTLDPTDDDLVEGNETIVIPGSTTVTGVDVSSATITLTDDATSLKKDSAKLSISGSSASVAEGSDATFTVTLSAGVSKEVTVAWTATGNTSDYSPTSGTVTFAANSAAGADQDIAITATDDALSEGDESFTVTLGTITSTLAQVSVDTSAGSDTATIAASDPITVNISGPSTVDEGDATSNYTVSLSGGTPTADLTVDYATADGTAVAGSDYTDTSGTLTFTQTDVADKTFKVQTTEDILAEGPETFSVTISSPTGGGGQTPTLGTSSVTTTIRDDDATSDPPDNNRPEAIHEKDITLSVNPNSVNENAGKTDFTVTATRGAGTILTDEITIALTLGGTADDSDYTAPAQASVTIPANWASGSSTLTLTLIDDELIEGDETIIVGGSYAGLGLVIGSALITVHDHDATYLSITGPTADVAEGSSATFTVTLSKAVAQAVTVAWNDAVIGTAEAGTDYTAGPGTVTFPANSAAGATQTFTIAVTDDSLSEAAETFGASLGAVTGAGADGVYVKTTAASAETTIAESDPITVSISGPSTVDEGDATTAYTVSLTGGTPTSDLTVSYATSDGTATAGSDYTSKSGTLTFTKTEAGSQTFTVQTTDDSEGEGTGETFTVTISSLSGGGGPAPSLGTSSVSTTIVDDDSDITLSVGPSSVREDADATDFTVTATLTGGTRTSATVVTIGTLAGSATKDTDYSVKTVLASITIPANTSSGTGTLTLDPTNDEVVEGNETITIPGTTTVGLSVSDATITLTDDTNAPGGPRLRRRRRSRLRERPLRRPPLST